MKTYADVVEKVGTKEHASFAGGWSRFVSWDSPYDGVVTASIYGNVVAKFFSSGRVLVTTHGYNTPSTFDAIATALGIGRGGRICGTEKKVPYLLGSPIVEDVAVFEDGKRIV